MTIMPMLDMAISIYQDMAHLPRPGHPAPIAARAEMEALVYRQRSQRQSRYMEDLLCALSGEGPRIYLATMEAMDEEAGHGSGATGPLHGRTRASPPWVPRETWAG